MSVAERVVKRVVEPAALRFYQWRGDPIARLLRPESREDPYPLYAEVRKAGLLRSPLGEWATASHATASAVLGDRRFSSSPVHRRGYAAPTYREGDPRAELPSSDLLTMDPPDHTRLRRLVSHAFSPRAIADLEPWIRETTERLVGSLDPASAFDLIDGVAFPLPIAVICHLLGVPADDQAQFRAWGHDLVTTLDPLATVESESRASELALTAYLRDLVAVRRAEPDDSLLSALVAAEEEGDRLTSDELVSTALLLLVAGFETTVNLIGNGTVALLRTRTEWARLNEEPSLIAGAVEEMLRYDSPVQMTSRNATEDIEIAGRVVPKGASVIVLLGGANRDPELFDDPDRLQIDRPNASRNLSFSFGIHSCVGAALARLEARVAFEALTTRFPTLELAGAPTRRRLIVLRGFEAVPVRAA